MVTSGVVTRIQIRATTIRDWDRKELLVPNKEFITGRLLNWSLTDDITRLMIPIGVAYGSDVMLAMKLAEEAAREHPKVLDDPAPFIIFEGFGDNSLQLGLRIYLPSLEHRLTTKSEINAAINGLTPQEYIEACHSAEGGMTLVRPDNRASYMRAVESVWNGATINHDYVGDFGWNKLHYSNRSLSMENRYWP